MNYSVLSVESRFPTKHKELIPTHWHKEETIKLDFELLKPSAKAPALLTGNTRSQRNPQTNEEQKHFIKEEHKGPRQAHSNAAATSQPDAAAAANNAPKPLPSMVFKSCYHNDKAMIKSNALENFEGDLGINLNDH